MGLNFKKTLMKFFGETQKALTLSALYDTKKCEWDILVNEHLDKNMRRNIQDLQKEPTFIYGAAVIVRTYHGNLALMDWDQLPTEKSTMSIELPAPANKMAG